MYLSAPNNLRQSCARSTAAFERAPQQMPPHVARINRTLLLADGSRMSAANVHEWVAGAREVHASNQLGRMLLEDDLSKTKRQSIGSGGGGLVGLRKSKEMHHMYEASRQQLLMLLKQSWGNGTLFAGLQKPFITPHAWVENGISGSITWRRAAPLALFLDLCRPQSMLEVGSFLGLSSNFFMRVMSPWGGTLTSVDPNVRHRVFEEPRAFFHHMNAEFKAQRRVRTIDGFWRTKGDAESGWWDYTNREPKYSKEKVTSLFSALPVISPEALGTDKFSMAFVDGAHSREAVRGDFDALLPLLKHEGACVIFDDVDPTAWPETFQAIVEIERESLEDMSGQMLYAQGTALFIDNGYIRKKARAGARRAHVDG